MRYWWQGLPASSLDSPTGNSGTFRYWIAGQAYVFLGNPPISQSLSGKLLMTVRGALGGGTYPAGLKGRGFVSVRGRARPGGILTLRGRGSAQVTGRFGVSGSGFPLAIFGRGKMMVWGRLTSQLGTALYGKGLMQARGRLQFGGKVNLAGKTLTQVRGMALSLKYLLLLYGRLGMQVKGSFHAQPLLERVIAYTAFFWKRPPP